MKTYEFILHFDDDETLKEEYENAKHEYQKTRKKKKKGRNKGEEKIRFTKQTVTRVKMKKKEMVDDEITLSDEDNGPRTHLKYEEEKKLERSELSNLRGMRIPSLSSIRQSRTIPYGVYY